MLVEGSEAVNWNEKTCWIAELGLIAYEPAFDLQRRLVAARKAGLIPDVLLLCEHPHVITLGRNGHRENLLASEHLLRQMGVEFRPTDRGGDITYHGPGQIVGYPILDLTGIRRDVAWYVRQLEEAMIRATSDFGITAVRKPGMTGVWVEGADGSAAEKLAAIGVHLSRWVTSHGFAYNVSTDLRYFDLIVPCGIPDKRATSLERLLGRALGREEVAPRIVVHLGDVFGREMQAVSRESLEQFLEEYASEQYAVTAHAVA
ncbi:MAG TPA: lipoyl(octanoyl) transferase LipB [Candidatus Acidoferrales bacterium]|nr:lipoyl(octanoyl) transferase LipB [Candidatus Acidoferrales bacterium]